MTTAASQPAHGPVDRALLAGLASDEWAGLLVATRTELRGRSDLTPELQWVRDTPTGRLVAGEGREAVISALEGQGELWAAIIARLPEGIAARLEPPVRSAAVAAPGDDVPSQLREELERARARARGLREERDTWQRRAEGADARAARAEAALQAAEATQQRLEQELGALQRALSEADEVRERALDRERRRRDGERDRLARENAELRRREEQRLAAARRRRAEQESREQAPTAEQRLEPVPRVPPGRPTRLPPDLVAGTTEWARALLGPGRLVFVDGYNVTRQHRPSLDLEGQRSWLVQLMVTAVAVHRWRPVVVFDGQQAGGSRPPAGRQRVEVRFTSEGITADDELVLAVEGTDEPVVVVTDDRELSDRVRASDADVVGTTAFLSVARG